MVFANMRLLVYPRRYTLDVVGTMEGGRGGGECTGVPTFKGQKSLFTNNRWLTMSKDFIRDGTQRFSQILPYNRWTHGANTFQV